MSPPKCLSPQAARTSDENAPIRTTKYVIPHDAVRLTPDGKLDEKHLREVISHIEPFAKGRKLRRSDEFRALVEKALKLSVSQLVISRVTGASVTYVRRVDAEIKSRCQNKKISEEIRQQASTLRGTSNKYPKAFRLLTEECLKTSKLSVIELAHALDVNPEFVRNVKREMQGLQKPKCVSPPEIDEEDPALLPERRLMNCASSFNVEQCGGRHEITCFDSRGDQIGRMIVELARPLSQSYVIVIDQNGRKTSYFNGGERLEFLQKLTGQKL
ncbi:hypothetical protein [Sutterella wadsworthensis]|uniref:hypothetical protein n=1 Tax=Sutterella wadsworthensis TaxID=40545 RepID=UPI003AEFDB9F